MRILAQMFIERISKYSAEIEIIKCPKYQQNIDTVHTHFQGLHNAHDSKVAGQAEYLKNLTLSQTKTAVSALKAFERIKSEAQKDPALAEGIINVYCFCTDTEIFVGDDAVNILTSGIIDPMRAVDFYLENYKNIFLGSAVHYLADLWEETRRKAQ